MNWPLVRLDECARIVGGATPSTSIPEYWDGDINWATPKDLSNQVDIHIARTSRKITAAGLASCAAELLPPGSVLFSSRAPIGHVAITTSTMATNQGFKSLVPDTRLADAGYLYWWLRSHRAFMESLGNGATFKEVSKAVVSRVKIPLPPLEDQRRIAAILDQADALRSKRRNILTRLGELPGILFSTAFGDPIQNPRGHPVRELSALIDPARPITYGILKPGPDILAGVPYVRVVDIKNGRIEIDNVRRTTQEIAHQYRRSTLRTGDLLMSIRGHVGRTALTPKELDGANITQDTARLSVTGANPSFVRCVLEHSSMVRWMGVRTRGAAVKGINLGDLKRMPVPLPSRDEQDRFALKIQQVQELGATAGLQLDRLNSLFASLQHRAFRGELTRSYERVLETA